MLYPIDRLLEGRGDPLVVDTGKSVRDALVLMVQKDYSQLPIVDSDGYLVGIISEQSIARTYFHLGERISLLDVKVTNCSDKAVTLPKGRDIFDALDLLQNTYALVIVEDRKPVGIITSYDTTNFFRGLSEGLVMVEDIEVTLKQYIDDALPDDDSRETARQNAFRHLMKGENDTSPTYDRMTLADYVNLVSNSKNWERFESRLESKEFFQQYMDQVREIRNQLAHFRGSLDSVQHDVLKRAREWLAGQQRVELLVLSTAEESTEGQQFTREGDFSQLYLLLHGFAPLWSPGDYTEFSFIEIEERTRSSLPPSAKEHRSWWANEPTSGSQALVWMKAGFQVEDVDFALQRVRFKRTDVVLQQLFLGDILERLKSERPGITRASKAQPQSWLSFGAGKTGVQFAWVFGSRKSFRVELYVDMGYKQTNKSYFDKLLEHKKEVEAEIGQALKWDRLERKQASRISLESEYKVDLLADEAQQQPVKRWAVSTMARFYDAFHKRVREL
jgi:CBS domain-containing protein